MLLNANLDLQLITTQALTNDQISNITIPRAVQVPIWVQFSSGGSIVDPEALIANILTSSVAGTTVITTDSPHGFTSGDTVTIAGHTGTPHTISTSAVSLVTATITTATPGVVTSARPHGLSAGDPVSFTTDGVLPDGITAGVTYYVIATGLTTSDFEISAIAGGSAINTSGSPSGIHTVTLPNAVITVPAHGLSNGDTVIIADHNGSEPAIDGSYIASNVTTNTFLIPVTVTTAGSGGTAERATSTPDLNTSWAITVTGLNTFTIATAVTAAGAGGTATRITDLDLRWTVKSISKFDQDPPIATVAPGGFVKTGSGTTTIFKASCNYITAQLNKLLGIEPPSVGVVTITNASPAVVSLTAHGLLADAVVVFTTDGTLPEPLVAGVEYYVISDGLTADEFEVSSTQGGSAVNTTTAGSGTHTVTGVNSGDDIPSVDLMAELSWNGAHPGKTNWVPHTVRNDLYKSGETDPVTTGGAQGIDAIGSGAAAKTITFAVPLAYTPMIETAIIEKPSSGADNLSVMSVASISNTGFTAYLSATTPSTGYNLHWKVIEP